MHYCKKWLNKDPNTTHTMVIWKLCLHLTDNQIHNHLTNDWISAKWLTLSCSHLPFTIKLTDQLTDHRATFNTIPNSNWLADTNIAIRPFIYAAIKMTNWLITHMPTDKLTYPLSYQPGMLFLLWKTDAQTIHQTGSEILTT